MNRVAQSNHLHGDSHKPVVCATMFLLLSLLAGCNFPGQEESSKPALDSPLPSESSTGVETEHTDLQQGKVLLFGKSESGLIPMDDLRNEVGALASGSGLDFAIVETISSADISNDVVVVVVVETDPGLSELVQAKPQTQFLAIGVPGLSAADNLNLLGAEDIRIDRQAFISGYMAATITDDWRVGVIAFGDQPEVNAARLGFMNGARYFCGLCRPAFPPFLEYPQDIVIDSFEQNWEGARATIEANQIRVVYLTPLSAFESRVEDLLTTNNFIMGDGPRPDRVPAERWVATVQYDVVDGLRSLWSDLVEGEGGVSIALHLEITDVNPALLSPGRERLAQDTLNELEAGFIDTDESPPGINER